MKYQNFTNVFVRNNKNSRRILCRRLFWVVGFYKPTVFIQKEIGLPSADADGIAQTASACFKSSGTADIRYSIDSKECAVLPADAMGQNLPLRGEGSGYLDVSSAADVLPPISSALPENPTGCIVWSS